MKTTPLALRRLLDRRYGAVALFVGICLFASFVIRIVLLAKARAGVSWDASLAASFGVGLVYDFGSIAWASLPLTLLLCCLPSGFFQRRLGRAVTRLGFFGLFAVLLFDGAAEWLFWDEFGCRFNFIAVDYLVYSKEVLANIRESYPMPAIIAGIGAGALLLDWGFWRSGLPQLWMQAPPEGFRRRAAAALLWLLPSALFGSLLGSDQMPAFENFFNAGLAHSGPWSLFAAFRNNELDYEQFYMGAGLEDCYADLREELVQDGSILLEPKQLDTLRYIADDRPEAYPNIIQITVESLSADLMGCFGSKEGLTPNLDALAKKSLLFDRFYATGTRTVRGMEALTMSIPPTPGRSIIKRKLNTGMFTLGSVLRTRGYDTAFLYGGYGYFDNMNSFFGGNGYRIVDRASVSKEDVTFANAWGACDGDLLDWTLREADEAHARGGPFHYFVMTTSNHRPYTYPEGKIDLPSKVSGRRGGVKYTDYAIGAFLREAESRPWFKDTIFVVVADHCASSAGRSEIPLERYHIPLLIYAPGGQVAPGRNSTLMSQIDYAPTLLGLMHWSYPSRFFGHDINRVAATDAHLLLGTYQLLGHIEQGKLTVLRPKKSSSSFDVRWESSSLDACAEEQDGRQETIAFYQAASDMYKRGAYQELSSQEFQRYSEIGRLLARCVVRNRN